MSYNFEQAHLVLGRIEEETAQLEKGLVQGSLLAPNLDIVKKNQVDALLGKLGDVRIYHVSSVSEVALRARLVDRIKDIRGRLRNVLGENDSEQMVSEVSGGGLLDMPVDAALSAASTAAPSPADTATTDATATGIETSDPTTPAGTALDRALSHQPRRTVTLTPPINAGAAPGEIGHITGIEGSGAFLAEEFDLRANVPLSTVFQVINKIGGNFADEVTTHIIGLQSAIATWILQISARYSNPQVIQAGLGETQQFSIMMVPRSAGLGEDHDVTFTVKQLPDNQTAIVTIKINPKQS